VSPSEPCVQNQPVTQSHPNGVRPVNRAGSEVRHKQRKHEDHRIPNVILLLSTDPGHKDDIGWSWSSDDGQNDGKSEYLRFDTLPGRAREEFNQRCDAGVGAGEGVGVVASRIIHLRDCRVRVLFPRDLLPPIRSPGQHPGRGE
jgi:hypothetical protein